MEAITLGILAGGRGARLGGVDKALLAYRGERLVDRAARNLGDGSAGDAACLLGRAREGVAAGAVAGFRNIPDLRAGALGPLAGLEALLAATRTAWLLTSPVDLRDVPAGLAGRLRAHSDGAMACVVRDADGLQPLLALWPVPDSLAAVRSALDAGRLSMHGLLDVLPHAEIDISPMRLGNLNAQRDFDEP
jgi:molybdopterin-guanine dinucleotide biosynthesis protein A